MTKAMVVSVGGTPAPIIKSIIWHKPEFVSFLASQDTCDLVATIKNDVNNDCPGLKSEMTLIDDVNDLIHCHEKAEESVSRVIIKGYTNEDVVVDYTGGTKNMSVALTLAAITHGFSFSYVGGKERTKDGVGIVIDGYEEVYRNVNPWDFFAIQERRKIILLFNQYQFKAARDLADEVVSKGTKYKSLFKRMALLVDGYHKWDLFRHQEALAIFGKAKIEELVESDDKQFRLFAKATEERLDFLRRIVTDNKKSSISFILDIYSNAERRYEEGKIDDAILRLYRLVEMMAQERLSSQYNIDASNVLVEQIPQPLQNAFIKDYKSKRDGKIKIPQTAAFELLYVLNDNLGRLFREKKHNFLDMQSSRNYSYLAHGFQSVKESTFLKLKDFLLGLEMFKMDDAPRFPKFEI